MLEINVVLADYFNEATNEFEDESFTIHLEHSLVSMSKWESKFEKVFLSKTDKTSEEVLEYIKMMIITEDYPDDVIELLTEPQMLEIKNYISRKNSATFFREDKLDKQSGEQVTTELIYYWMFSYQIPIETESWNFNRLFNLIRIFSIKNSKQTKRSSRQIADERRALNEQRKAKYNTNG